MDIRKVRVCGFGCGATQAKSCPTCGKSCFKTELFDRSKGEGVGDNAASEFRKRRERRERRATRYDYKGYALRRLGNNSWTICSSVAAYIAIGRFKNLREAMSCIDEGNVLSLQQFVDSTMFVPIPKKKEGQYG